MGARAIHFAGDARSRILKGADIVADLAELTLGPAARHVLVDRAHAHPVITGGGYAVALEVDLSDPTAQLGARALRDLAWRTSDTVGDGTATAIVLCRAVLRGIVRAAAAGLDPNTLRAALDDGVGRVIALLDGTIQPASDETALVKVASTAAGGDGVIGLTIGRASARVGIEGMVLVEDGHGTEDRIEHHDGMQFDQGWLAPAFVTDETAQLVDYDEPYLLLCASRISNLDAIVPALNAFASSGKPLAIIAEDVTGEALATLIANRRRAGAKLAAVKAPGVGPWRRLLLGDIAVATGATVIGDEQGLRPEEVGPAMVGRARRIRIGRVSTTIIDGAGRAEDVAARRSEIRHAIEREKYLSYDREQQQRRLARLASGVAIARFGGATGTVIAERKERAKGAAAAARAAARHGSVVGGAAGLLHATRALPGAEAKSLEEGIATRILREALAAPLIAIARNRGRDGRSIAARLLENGLPSAGFDARADRVHDLLAAGVLDPVEVVRTALRAAVATGGRLGAIEAAIAPA